MIIVRRRSRLAPAHSLSLLGVCRCCRAPMGMRQSLRALTHALSRLGPLRGGADSNPQSALAAWPYHHLSELRGAGSEEQRAN